MDSALNPGVIHISGAAFNSGGGCNFTQVSDHKTTLAKDTLTHADQEKITV